MSLDVTLRFKDEDLFEANITHNLNKMAKEAGVYEACWRPEDINAKKAKDIIPLLESGIQKMKEDPEHFKKFDAPNGWGLYKDFLPWLEKYLAACKSNKKASIKISR